MIKAAFFDMDGTIYSHTSKCVPKSTWKALEVLRENDIKIFLATGRHLTEVDEFPVGQIPFDGYVLSNGQICLDTNRNLVYGNAIKEEDGKYLLDAFVNKTMPLMIAEQDKLYMNYVTDEVIKGQAAVSTEVPEVQEYTGNPVYLVVSFGGKGLEEKLAPKIPNCKITRWCDHAVDIVSKEGGKVTGIKKMMELYGIRQEETIAFGDGENDMEMLEFAGIGVALGNADSEVKAIADYVADDIDEDGIWNALKHFEII